MDDLKEGFHGERKFYHLFFCRSYSKLPGLLHRKTVYLFDYRSFGQEGAVGCPDDICNLRTFDFSKYAGMRRGDHGHGSATGEKSAALTGVPAAAAFAELYERSWSKEEQSICEVEEKDGMIFRFGLDLRLFFSGKELICFTAEHFDREWEEMEIVV